MTLQRMHISKYFYMKTYSSDDLQVMIVYLLRNKELSDITKRQIATKVTQWVSYLEPPRTIHNLITNQSTSITALKSNDKIKHSASNHHVYISAIVAFIKYILKNEIQFKEWKDIEKDNWKPLAEHYDTNSPTELQKEKVMSFDEINTIRKSLEKGSFERLLLSFYTIIEPIRADYYATELIIHSSTNSTLISESTEDNYIILTDDKGHLIVKDFKTKKTYEKIENTLSSELLDELHTSLLKYPRNYLFVMDDKKSPFTRKLFSNWACRTLTRVLKQQMTLTVLRHIYITNKIKSKTSSTELIDIAKKMGHSRGVQRVYEWQ